MDKREEAEKRACMCMGWAVFAGCMAACCATGLIVCGVVITKPIIETNSLEFQETTCTTNQSFLTGQNIDCGCGKNCRSNYPCLRITVTHVLNNATVNAVLFDTESRLNSNGDNAENRQCVTAPCDRSESSNRAEVLNFNDTYAPGQSYTCLYHPDSPTKVLLTRLFTWDAMFHSMLLTSITTFIFTIITIYCLYQCKQAKNKVASIPVSAPTRVPGAQPGHFITQPGGFITQPGGFITQPGGFITQPPAYTAGGGNLEMAPPPPALYSSEKSGYTYT